MRLNHTEILSNQINEQNKNEAEEIFYTCINLMQIFAKLRVGTFINILMPCNLRFLVSHRVKKEGVSG